MVYSDMALRLITEALHIIQNKWPLLAQYDLSHSMQISAKQISLHSHDWYNVYGDFVWESQPLAGVVTLYWLNIYL